MGNIDFQGIEERIGYSFNDKDLLKQALTHKSYYNEKAGIESSNRNNERLEFLGDAILDLVISTFLYSNYMELSEGELSELRSQLVSETSLAEISRSLCLGNYLLMARGEILNKGNLRNSALADAFEAIIAAIFLDSDYFVAESIALNLFFELSTKNLNQLKMVKDSKSTLQELVQKSFKILPEYVLLKDTGPDHDKVFFVGIRINDQFISYGYGKSKKEAEQVAASLAINIITSD